MDVLAVTMPPLWFESPSYTHSDLITVPWASPAKRRQGRHADCLPTGVHISWLHSSFHHYVTDNGIILTGSVTTSEGQIMGRTDVLNFCRLLAWDEDFELDELTFKATVQKFWLIVIWLTNKQQHANSLSSPRRIHSCLSVLSHSICSRANKYND